MAEGVAWGVTMAAWLAIGDGAPPRGVYPRAGVNPTRKKTKKKRVKKIKFFN
jgi:hypothetical protein